MSPYAEYVDNLRMSGERIVPLTDEKAKDWVAEHLDGEDYIKISGDVEE